MPLQDKWEQVKSLAVEHKRFIPVAAFMAGLSVDVVSLTRFDHWFTLTQHGIYLGLIALLYSLEFLNANGQLNVERFGPQGQKFSHLFWKYHEELIHFFFGSLLSANTVFYFKSGSLINSFFFMVIILLCLFANEVERFRRLGLMMRGALLCLCVATYFIYVIPIMMGSIGVLPFLLAMGCTATAMILLWLLMGFQFGLKEAARRIILKPAMIVIIGLNGFYFLKLLPPVPLSLNFVGIYHKVEKVEGGYQVKFTKPWWKVWHNGDQDFESQTGDRIYCYFNVLSPGGFRDRLRVRWLFLNAEHSWQSSDAIPVQVHGGRDEGYRGYTFKENFQPGYWQVQIETSDEREIGRIYFSVNESTDQSPREFQTEIL
jgi:hypothetical protein